MNSYRLFRFVIKWNNVVLACQENKETEIKLDIDIKIKLVPHSKQSAFKTN
jgi:hypothetical protein